MSGRRVNDDAIYEPDAILVGIIAWGSSKVCSSCDTELPANTDYFAPDKSGAAASPTTVVAAAGWPRGRASRGARGKGVVA